MSTPSRTSNRAAILEAAVRVILRDGALGLTLDAVAREAAVSKGGLLYHFKSKDALIQGMLEHFLAEYEQEVTRGAGGAGGGAAALLRSYIDASFNVDTNQLSPSQARDLHVALFAAVANSPKLVAPFREFADRFMARIAGSGAGSADALLLWLAVDGLWLWDLFGLIPAGGPAREELIARLRERADLLGAPTTKEVRS